MNQEKMLEKRIIQKIQDCHLRHKYFNGFYEFRTQVYVYRLISVEFALDNMFLIIRIARYGLMKPLRVEMIYGKLWFAFIATIEHAISDTSLI